MPLTDTAIRKAELTDKVQRLFDGGWLYLELAPAGGKWWRLKYRFDGKEKRFSLGVYPKDRCLALGTGPNRRPEPHRAVGKF